MFHRVSWVLGLFCGSAVLSLSAVLARDEPKQEYESVTVYEVWATSKLNPKPYPLLPEGQTEDLIRAEKIRDDFNDAHKPGGILEADPGRAEIKTSTAQRPRKPRTPSRRPPQEYFEDKKEGKQIVDQVKKDQEDRAKKDPNKTPTEAGAGVPTLAQKYPEKNNFELVRLALQGFALERQESELNQEKDRLDKAREELIKEMRVLRDKAGATPEEKKALEDKKKKYLEDMKAYEKRRGTFEGLVREMKSDADALVKRAAEKGDIAFAGTGAAPKGELNGKWLGATDKKWSLTLGNNGTISYGYEGGATFEGTWKSSRDGGFTAELKNTYKTIGTHAGTKLAITAISEKGRLKVTATPTALYTDGTSYTHKPWAEEVFERSTR